MLAIGFSGAIGILGDVASGLGCFLQVGVMLCLGGMIEGVVVGVWVGFMDDAELCCLCDERSGAVEAVELLFPVNEFVA